MIAAPSSVFPEAKIEELKAFISQERDGRQVKKALAVKLLYQGYGYESVVQILDVSLGSISNWKQAYEVEGIVGFSPRHQGRKSYLSTLEKEEVVKWLQQKDIWTVGELEYHLAEVYDVVYESKQSYYNLFSAAGMSWKKTSQVNPKADPEVVAAKKAEIQRLLAQYRNEIETGKLRVLFLDECHLMGGDLKGYVWGRQGERLEVPVVNQRERQTYYGAIDLLSKRLLIKAQTTGNTTCTIAYLQFLQQQFPNQRLLILWDGASYHRSQELRTFLEQVNQGLTQGQWKIHCVRFAPNDPSQNPIEDAWLQAKTWLRKMAGFRPSFTGLKALFEQFCSLDIFDFPKLYSYGAFSEIK